MARHFGAQHTKSGYAAMGGSLRRPKVGGTSNRSVKEAIAAEARKAARMAQARKSK